MSQTSETTPVGPRVGPIAQLYRSYFLALRWSRLAMVAFWTLAALFFLWAIPWLPAGMSVEDYSTEVAFTFSLLGACILLGGVAITLRIFAHRRRQALVAWTTLYDETTGLRNRRYFLERLKLECEQAAERRSQFALILFALEPVHERSPRQDQSTTAALRSAGQVLASRTRLSDLVAVIGPRELVVLTPGLGPDAAEPAAHRLGRILLREVKGWADKPDQRPTLTVGVAVFGGETTEPGDLLRAARSHLVSIAGESEPPASVQPKQDAA
ncbi:MAG: diguanylate cyclase [Dehalococcoidia bacterium]